MCPRRLTRSRIIKTLATLTAALAFAGASAEQGKANRSNPTTSQIICQVFGPYCSQALRVAKCESGLNTWASNGQYLGLFQMGSYARARYGHGGSAWTQARAAYRYFVDSGRGWSPWTCKPW